MDTSINTPLLISQSSIPHPVQQFNQAIHTANQGLNNVPEETVSNLKSRINSIYNQSKEYFNEKKAIDNNLLGPSRKGKIIIRVAQGLAFLGWLATALELIREQFGDGEEWTPDMLWGPRMFLIAFVIQTISSVAFMYHEHLTEKEKEIPVLTQEQIDKIQKVDELVNTLNKLKPCHPELQTTNPPPINRWQHLMNLFRKSKNNIQAPPQNPDPQDVDVEAPQVEQINLDNDDQQAIAQQCLKKYKELPEDIQQSLPSGIKWPYIIARLLPENHPLRIKSENIVNHYKETAHIEEDPHSPRFGRRPDLNANSTATPSHPLVESISMHHTHTITDSHELTSSSEDTHDELLDAFGDFFGESFNRVQVGDKLIQRSLKSSLTNSEWQL